MERKVLLKNLSNSMVTYNIPNRHVSRQLLPYSSIQVPFDEIQEGLYQQGIKALFAEGILATENNRDAIELDLEVGKGIVNTEPVDKEEIISKLKGSNGELFKFLKTASPTVKENVALLAIEHRIVDAGKVKIIKDATGTNVLAAITREQELRSSEEEE